MKRKNRITSLRRQGDVLIVKILDVTNNVFYKKRVPISDVEGMRQMITDLDAYGLDIKKMLEIKVEEKEERWW